MLPECGGYKVHRDKLARLGVPIYTSHTILSANGTGAVESVTIARVDERFKPVPGTERSYACDTVLVAVGLDPVGEFHEKAREFGLPSFAAGDAEEIAEASAAIFSGKIRGLEVARALGQDVGEIPADWYRTAEVLKSKPGPTVPESAPPEGAGVFPVLHCFQEIPCDPCTAACPRHLIGIDPADIRALPDFRADRHERGCSGCEKCVALCPGLAITMVDYRKDPEFPTVAVPFEFLREAVHVGDTVVVTDTLGQALGQVEVAAVRAAQINDRTVIVKVRAPRAIAREIAGLRIQAESESDPLDAWVEHPPDDTIICRCERVTAGDIRKLIREGVRDINEIKAVARTCMGPCGAKTCGPLILRLFREEGVPEAEVVDQPKRPLFMEVPLGIFAGLDPRPRDHGTE